jgi:threonine aldolase
MTEAIVDLRSDTLTRPTPAMRRAMAAAEVGDDVFGEDPTVRRLEEAAAAATGMEASLFVPTGTLGNQIAIHLLAPRGTEVILGDGCHVYNWELGAMAALSGALPRLVSDEGGSPAPEAVRAAVRSGPYYVTRTSLVCLENTHNMRGGAVTPADRMEVLAAVAREAGLPVHLDGARVWNAAVALGLTPEALCRGATTVMVCLSKGLGAPVGSLLCGPTELVKEARVARKRFGGGMRQAGVLAAAGLVGIETMVERLAEDHEAARALARAAAGAPGLEVDGDEVRTNIVLVRTSRPGGAPELVARLEARGVRSLAVATDTVRLVTHYDLPAGGVERAAEVLATGLPPGSGGLP